MKKSLFFSLFLVFLTGCSEQEQFEQAVLKDMQKEQDIKDYNIDPDNITECVVDDITRKMPGFFFGDPQRLEAYVLYTKMLGLTESENPEKTLKELQVGFGSGRALSKAKGEYSQSVFECIATMLMKYGEKEPKKAPESKSEAVSEQTKAPESKSEAVSEQLKGPDSKPEAVTEQPEPETIPKKTKSNSELK